MLHEIDRLEEPLRFTCAHDALEIIAAHTVTNSGGQPGTKSAVCAAHVMRSGSHIAEFTINQSAPRALSATRFSYQKHDHTSTYRTRLPYTRVPIQLYIGTGVLRCRSFLFHADRRSEHLHICSNAGMYAGCFVCRIARSHGLLLLLLLDM